VALILHILHVVGAVFVVGPLAVIPMLGLRAIRTGDALQLRGLVRSAIGFGAGAVLVAGLGFGLMSVQTEDELSLATPWILWSAILFSLAALLHFSVVIPLLSRAAHLASNPPRSSGYAPVAGSSGVVSLLLLAIVILMVAQPA
jgi:uncharacterized membrane protein